MSIFDLTASTKAPIEVSWRTRTKAALLVGLFFAVILLFVLEIPYFSNTIDANRMVGLSMLIGLVFGSFIGYYFSRNERQWMDRLIITTLFATIISLCSPLLASISNRTLSKPPASQSMTFIRSEGRIAERYGVFKGQQVPIGHYNLYLLNKDELLHLQSEVNPFEGVSAGEKVEIPIKKGLWGFEVVALNAD